MNNKQFSMLYNENSQKFEKASKRLRVLLEAELKQIRVRRKQALGVEDDAFRIRVVEVRLKDRKALHSKICDDDSLMHARAFDPGHVNDLIGARLVCHNLEDVRALTKKIKDQQWPGVTHVRSIARGGVRDKEWLDTGHEVSGYRANHLDVQWCGDDKRMYYGELQIRTLLQDAWASFMHDDVYKSNALFLFPEHILQQLKHFSDLLYSLDGMAQSLRDYVDTTLIRESSYAAVLSLQRRHMHGFAEFKRRGLKVPAYESVRRADCYKVEGPHGHWQFEIDGSLGLKEKFVFPMVADTSVSNLRDLRVYRATRSGKFERVSREYYDRIDGNPPHRSIAITDKRATKRHLYRVQCEWQGVFRNEVEYVIAPWRDLYRTARVFYELEIWLQRKADQPPQMMALPEEQQDLPGHLKEKIERFESKRGNVGPELEYMGEENGYHRYRFAERDVTGTNFMCLFRNER